MDKSSLEIRLLGQYEVRLDGKPVDIPSRPAKLLFAYLVLTAGTRHPRERLAGLLWPESDENNARKNLRQALWRLRKAIGDTFLLIDNTSVALDDGSDYWLDTTLMANIGDKGLTTAAAAYKGELLPGFYEDWVLLERERLQAAHERIMQRLLDTLVGEERWLDVLEWAEQWIALGQVPEPAFRALMVAHAAQGDLSATAAAYERCATALKLDIGVDPSDETRTLYERLLEGDQPAVAARLTQTEASRAPALRHNLPHHSTPFIGRHQELAEIKNLLPKTRLLTLAGPGGMGKTRLALQAAGQVLDEYENGVFLVSLAPIDSPKAIIQTIAEAIGFPLSTYEDPKSQLLRHLRTRRYLLVIDNFDHLLDGAVLAGEILQETREVTILATSRERLNLQEETLLQIEGLKYPASPVAPDLLDYGAVQLFMNTARRVQPTFAVRPEDLPHIARICQLVEGMPLGILLAAAWVNVLSPAEISAEISHSLDFLQTEWRNVPGRHRSVRAAFEPSWKRLTEKQRELFGKLAIFRGGFTREAAETVAEASLWGLASLVNKSLIRWEPGAGRYDIHELLRQYAQDHLDAVPGVGQAIAKAHATYFAEFMAQRRAQLMDARQQSALAEIDADLENVRAAWRFWVSQHDARHIGMFLDSFWRVYEIRGWYNAGAELFQEAAVALRPEPGAIQDEDTSVVYAQALAHQAHFMAQRGHTESGLALAEESVEILRRFERYDELAFPLETLSWNASYVKGAEDFWEIERQIGETAGEVGDQWALAYTLCWKGRSVALQQDYQTGQKHVQESLRIFQNLGDYYATVWPGLELGNIAILLREYGEAKEYYSRVFEGAQENEYTWGLAKSARYLGSLALLMKDYEEARIYLLQSLRISDDLGLIRDVVNTLYDIAQLETANSSLSQATKLLTAIHQHPLSDQTRTFSLWAGDEVVRIRELAEALLAELQAKMPGDLFNEAIKRGRTSNFEALVGEYLNAYQSR